MSINYNHPAGVAEAPAGTLSDSVIKKTNIYLFDLLNEAREHGFKAADSWELTLVTDAGRKKLQEDFYPAVALNLSPEDLMPFFQEIKSRLKQHLNKDEQAISLGTIMRDELKHVVAYNAKRERK